MFRQPATARGFTLLELLAVLVLVGVATAITAVGMSRGYQASQERKALGMIVQSLRAARVDAIVRGQSTRLVFNLAKNRIQIPDKQSRALPGQVRLELTTARELGASYEFYPDGGSSGGNIKVIGSSDRQWRIHISWLTGAVEVRPRP